MNWIKQTTLLFGYENYNGTKCAVAEFYHKDMNVTTKMWVDCKNGTTLKITTNGIDSNNTPYEFIEEYIAIYGVVTDDDVKKPDLTDYEKLENN